MLVLLIIHNTGVRSHVFGVRSHRLRGLPGVAFGAGNLWRGGLVGWSGVVLCVGVGSRTPGCRAARVGGGALFAASVPGSFSLTFSFSVFGGFGEIALQLEDVGRGEARA